MKVVDMHCDTITELYKKRQDKEYATLMKNQLHMDLEKMQQGNYAIQNFALYVDLRNVTDPYRHAKELMMFFREEMETCREHIRIVQNWNEIEENWNQGILSAMLTLEEGGICQGDLKKLQEFYDGGARMMTLTWNFENELAYPNVVHVTEQDGRKTIQWEPDTKHGLKEQGIIFIEAMEEMGMIIDVSHLSDAGIWDVFRHTKKPFVASHSNARTIANHPRNLTDDMLLALSERGGVAGINFCDGFLKVRERDSEEQYSYVSDMVRHMEHMKQIGGIECIGLGSDFDGIPSRLEFENAAGIQTLADVMHQKKFTDREIEAVFSGNVLRVYKELL